MSLVDTLRKDMFQASEGCVLINLIIKNGFGIIKNAQIEVGRAFRNTIIEKY